MLFSLVQLSALVLICQVQLTHNVILQHIYQKYLKQQGLEFRENEFLGNKPILSEYDFVVIGGGVGGSVMANRLSENPKWKVLLLESGEDENIYTNIPLLAHFNSLTHFNWGYKMENVESHPQCLAMYNQQCPCPRGKGLGGSSILNYMIYTRGNKNDYAAYEAAGNEGWGYDSVLKYFLKSENNTSEFLDPDLHSRGGPLKVGNIPYPNVLTEKFTQAACELGYPLYDYTGKEPATEGFSKLQATVNKGQRYSSNRAYLKSIKQRTKQNLHISIFSQVTKILIDPKTLRAHGVEFHKNGVKRIVLAKKEVILSAGAIGSPQLLMLSGVGPEKHLKEFNIDVISNLKGVGENMQDHHSFFGLTFLLNRTNTGSTVEKNVVNVDQFLKWLKLGRGPLSVPGGVTGIGYLNTKYNTDKTWPDTEYIFAIGSFNSDAGRVFRKSMNIRKDMYESVYGNINNREVWSILPVVLRPKTRGYIKLKSKNPFKFPKIYYDFFEHKEDQEVMLEAIKNIIKISETDAFQSIGSRIHKTPIPGCAQYEFGCDDYWRCAMKYFTSSLYHHSCTCKMGPRSDPEAVVSNRLEVYGVTNLRVVDASIFPHVPSAHLYAPTVMVAEKAADFVKEDWKDVEDNSAPNSGCYSYPKNPQTNADTNNSKKTRCSQNNAQTTTQTTEFYTTPHQLDNQKQTTQYSTTTTSTTTTTAKPFTKPNTGGPVVPNQPNFVMGWQNYANKTWGTKPNSTSAPKDPNQVPTQQVSSTATSSASNFGNPSQTEFVKPETYPNQPSSTPPPYVNSQPSSTYPAYTPNQPFSTHPPYVNSQPSSIYPAYRPNQPSSTPPPYVNSRPSSTYPPNIPNQQPPYNANGYPNSINKIPSASKPLTNLQYPPQSGYPVSPAFQQQTPTNYIPPPDQQYSNQSSGYPSQPNNVPPSYPSGSYQIHTVYPGSSFPVKGPYQDSFQNNYQQTDLNSLPHPPAPQEQYYQPPPINGAPNQVSLVQSLEPQNPYHVHPNHPAAGITNNEIAEPAELIIPDNNNNHHQVRPTPAHQNGPQIPTTEDINYAGLTSLHNIPYYNQYFNQLRFNPNVAPQNISFVPAAIFVNPNLLYPSGNRYFNGRSDRLTKFKRHDNKQQGELKETLSEVPAKNEKLSKDSKQAENMLGETTKNEQSNEKMSEKVTIANNQKDEKKSEHLKQEEEPKKHKTEEKISEEHKELEKVEKETDEKVLEDKTKANDQLDEKELNDI